MFRTLRAPDTKVRPVMTGVALEVAVLIKNPPAVGRPARAKIEMFGMAGHAYAIRAIGVTRPNLVAARAREMKGHAPAVRTQAQSVRQALARARELARIAS